MTQVPNRFPHNDIISLTSEPVRYDLAESVGPDLKLGALWDNLSEAKWQDLVLSYGPAVGDGELRQLIATRHGVGADDVVTTIGGMQALFLIAFILCEPGDDVLIARPVFPNARTVLQAVGANLIDLPIGFDTGYRLDPVALKARLTSKTKLVSLASPQNPSGVALTPADVRTVLTIMDDVCPQAFLLIDETYREAVYGNDPVRESLVGLDERIISCSSLSKCHGAPGIRTGWLISRHRALREQVTLGKFNTTIANSRIDDAVAIAVLRDCDRIIAERRAHLKSGLAKTADLVAGNSDVLEWVRPDAGALCCLRLRVAAFDAAAVKRFYADLADHDVRVGPGSWFGETDHVFRLGFGLLPIPDLDEAFQRLSTVLRG